MSECWHLKNILRLRVHWWPLDSYDTIALQLFRLLISASFIEWVLVSMMMMMILISTLVAAAIIIESTRNSSALFATFVWKINKVVSTANTWHIWKQTWADWKNCFWELKFAYTMCSDGYTSLSNTTAQRDILLKLNANNFWNQFSRHLRRRRRRRCRPASKISGNALIQLWFLPLPCIYDLLLLAYLILSKGI